MALWHFRPLQQDVYAYTQRYYHSQHRTPIHYGKKFDTIKVSLKISGLCLETYKNLTSLSKHQKEIVKSVLWFYFQQYVSSRLFLSWKKACMWGIHLYNRIIKRAYIVCFLARNIMCCTSITTHNSRINYCNFAPFPIFFHMLISLQQPFNLLYNYH